MPKLTEKGQVVIVLTLIMLVALTIGIAISQRSINDVSTSSKTEQSSRAFSAAEAGIEKALAPGTTIPVEGLQVSLTTDNQSTAKVKSTGEMPVYTQALEYPPIGKAEFAHFWLAKPDDITPYYTQPNVYLFFGNGGLDPNSGFDENDKPAVEVNLITEDDTPGSSSRGTFISTRVYYDSDTIRARSNNFLYQGIAGAADFICSSSDSRLVINTSSSSNYPQPADREFYCRATINTMPNIGKKNANNQTITAEIPILLRVRILYSDKKQRLALSPITNPPLGNSCNIAAGDTKCSLPPQASIYTSIGVSGDTQRRIQLFQIKNVAPQFLDFAIFSNSNIQK